MKVVTITDEVFLAAAAELEAQILELSEEERGRPFDESGYSPAHMLHDIRRRTSRGIAFVIQLIRIQEERKFS